MPRLSANGLLFEYDLRGPAGAPPLLLIAGLGAQMISWEEGFCELLAAQPFRVVRFDNRDSGLSSVLDDRPAPSPFEVMGGELPPPYTLDDMADDAAALLDRLGLGSAHVAGASMGGFIGQLLALRHPRRVRSLALLMTASGSLAENVQPTPEATQALLTPPPPDREGTIRHLVEASRVLGGPRYFVEAEARRRAERSHDRAVVPAGAARQFAAIAAAPSRTAALAGLRLPALVVHGDADPLVPIENGRRLTAAIPGARLLTLPGVGHDLPRPLWPQVAEAIAANARRAPTTPLTG